MTKICSTQVCFYNAALRNIGGNKIKALAGDAIYEYLRVNCLLYLLGDDWPDLCQEIYEHICFSLKEFGLGR